MNLITTRDICLILASVVIVLWIGWGLSKEVIFSNVKLGNTNQSLQKQLMECMKKDK
jgi:hypothetical protein